MACGGATGGMNAGGMMNADEVLALGAVFTTSGGEAGRLALVKDMWLGQNGFLTFAFNFGTIVISRDLPSLVLLSTP